MNSHARSAEQMNAIVLLLTQTQIRCEWRNCILIRSIKTYVNNECKLLWWIGVVGRISVAHTTHMTRPMVRACGKMWTNEPRSSTHSNFNRRNFTNDYSKLYLTAIPTQQHTHIVIDIVTARDNVTCLWYVVDILESSAQHWSCGRT